MEEWDADLGGQLKINRLCITVMVPFLWRHLTIHVAPIPRALMLWLIVEIIDKKFHLAVIAMIHS